MPGSSEESAAVTVEITNSAFSCLQDIESFKVNTLGAEAAGHFVEQILSESVVAIGNNPTLYRINSDLADYGLHVHERIDEYGYRFLYELHDSVASILLILHTKQDIVSALFRHMMFRQ